MPEKNWKKLKKNTAAETAKDSIREYCFIELSTLLHTMKRHYHTIVCIQLNTFCLGSFITASMRRSMLRACRA